MECLYKGESMKFVRLALVLWCLLSVVHTQAVLNPTLAVDSNSSGGFWSSINTAYNTQTNQILATWVTPEGLYGRLFSPNGLPDASPILLLNSEGEISIASSALTSSYNTQNNQFLITFVGVGESGYAIYFFIVDQAVGIIEGPTEALILPGNPFAAPACCYNSTTNQYGITVNNGDGQVCFAIINADGTVSSTTVIPGSVIASDTYTSSISYNSTNNQYLISWQTTTPTLVFVVYNADGSIDSGIGLVTVPFTIESGGELYSLLVPNIYNSRDNQYLIAWTTSIGNCYFAIYDASGSSVVAETPFALNTLDPSVYMFIVGTFNPTNNTYFLTWMGNDSNYYYSIINADGSIVVSEQLIPNYLSTGAQAGGRGSATYMPVFGGSIYINWINQYNSPFVNGFSAIYSNDPLGPLSTSTSRLNRFANYGEYFNQLAWWSLVNSSVTSYQLYRSTTLLATMPGTQMTYQDHNQSAYERILYKVVGYGVASSPLVLMYIQSS